MQFVPRLFRLAACLSLVAATMLSIAGSATAGEAGDVGFVPRASTPDALQRAEPLDDHLSGLSEQEPRVCVDADGDDLAAIRRELVPGSAGAGAITVSPASTEFQGITGGSSYRHCIVVHNRGDEVERYRLTTLDIVGSPNPRQQQDIIEPPTALGSWVRPLITEFAVQPGERVWIPLLIEPPGDLPLGTLTAGIRVTQLRPEAEDVTGAAIRPSVTHRLHLTVPGGTARKLEVRDVRAPRVLWHGDGPIAYRARFVVANRGSILDVYDVRLRVRGLGRQVGTASVPTSTVLPGGANSVVLVWDELPWIGWYSPRATVRSRAGEAEVELPNLLILPPWPVVIALLAALLLPILALLLRWRRRRSEWRGYLDDEDLDDGAADDAAYP